MAGDIHIDWNDGAFASFLAVVEPELLADLAAEVADVAHAIAPVRMRHTPVPRWAKRGHVGHGGRMKASVQWDTGRDYIGRYADIAALWYGRFLDPKARQLHYLRPFLPSALFMVVDGQTYYI